MKTSRLLAYGIIGVVAGLLIENKALALKGKARDTGRRLQKNLKKKLA